MRFMCGYRGRGLGWFRIFGYGLSWKDTRVSPPLFSQREGYRSRLHLGPIWIGFLRPNP